MLHSHSSKHGPEKHTHARKHAHAHVNIHTHLELQSGESRASKSSRSDITLQHLCKLTLLSVLLIFKNGQSTVETIDTHIPISLLLICEMVMQEFGLGFTGNVYSQILTQHLTLIWEIIYKSSLTK